MRKGSRCPPKDYCSFISAESLCQPMTPTERNRKQERILEISAHKPAEKAPFSERHPLISGFGRSVAASIFLLGVSCAWESLPRPGGMMPHGMLPALRNPERQIIRPPPPVPVGRIVVPPRLSDLHVSPSLELASPDPLRYTPPPASPVPERGAVTLEFGIQSNVLPIEPGPNPLPPITTFGPILRFDISDR